MSDRPTVAVLDYGSGNLRSVVRAVERAGAEVELTSDFESCLAAGVQPRAEINSPDGAKYYLDMGVRHFCMATDINILHGWWKTNGEQLRRAVEGS